MDSMRAVSLSADGTLAVLSKGDNEVGVWQLAEQGPKAMKSDESARKLTVFRQIFPSGTGSRFLIAVSLSPQRKELTETARDIGQLLKFGR